MFAQLQVHIAVPWSDPAEVPEGAMEQLIAELEKE